MSKKDHPVIFLSDNNENSIELHPILSSYCLKNKKTFIFKHSDRDFIKKDYENLKIEDYPIISFNGVYYGYNNFMSCWGRELIESPLDLRKSQSIDEGYESRKKIYDEYDKIMMGCDSCGA